MVIWDSLIIGKRFLYFKNNFLLSLFIRLFFILVSNLLAHRDFSNAYVAKFIIEKDRIITENSNRSHGIGSLDISAFEPFPKNPPISKVFREIGLADELGSGMRNTYKYTKLYSGGVPEFIEGDVFRTIIPLTPVATSKVGPQSYLGHTTQDTTQDRTTLLLEYCVSPKTREEMQKYLGITNREYFRKFILSPLLAAGLLKMTIPDKPTSKNQKYVKA